MTLPQTAAGWYHDPSGAPCLRYWDGQLWTGNVRPQPTTIVEGPNHALHAILTLFTFPLCGGWAWVWLIVALGNRKRVRYI
jgi:Protein of unknown function (DUF2510)